MKCTCIVCGDRDFNPIGLKLFESEVCPYFKRNILKFKYPEHPFPMKHTGILQSLLAYSQALAYNRAHSIEAVYYTDNKLMLKYSRALFERFGMQAVHASQVPANHNMVCEFNVETNLV